MIGMTAMNYNYHLVLISTTFHIVSSQHQQHHIKHETAQEIQDQIIATGNTGADYRNRKYRARLLQQEIQGQIMATGNTGAD